ncbi:MAG: tetratricopeptide repeat protein [Croceibacterium sp.]
MFAAALLTLVQLADTAPGPALPHTLAEDRLSVCMDHARNDPTSAITEASGWAAERSDEDRSYPQQCLGMAYTALLRWDAAERAFLSAREAAPADNHFRRAQLAGMAANADLAQGNGAAAQLALDLALADAQATGDPALQAIVQVDRARALVQQGDTAQADAALTQARTLDPQSPYAWLLSATLSRRLGKLDEAQAQIQTAVSLAPDYPESGLEAGVISMLRGNEDAAAQSWRSVIALEPNGDSAATARAYLAQLDQPAAPAPTGR